MDRSAILSELRAERDRMDKAIAALSGGGGGVPSPFKQIRTKSRARGITAAGRRKLSEMMKARWAARRKAASAGKKK